MLSRLQRRVWPVILKTWQGWQEHDGFLLSAAMAYYAAFSLFPLVLVLISLLGTVLRFWPHAEDAQQELLKLVAENTGPWMAEQLGTLLSEVKAQAGLGGPIGTLTLMIAAIGVFIQLDYIFDRIWKLESPQSKSWRAYARDVLWDRVSAFLMLLGVGGALLVIFVANLVLTGLRPLVVSLPGGAFAWQGGQMAFTLITNALLFGIIFKVLPKPYVRWRYAFSGGVFVSLVWFLGQQILVKFVIGSHYSAYGVVGSFIAIMLWLYYAAAVIFLGAEFVQALCRASPQASKCEKKP